MPTINFDSQRKINWQSIAKDIFNHYAPQIPFQYLKQANAHPSVLDYDYQKAVAQKGDIDLAKHVMQMMSKTGAGLRYQIENKVGIFKAKRAEEIDTKSEGRSANEMEDPWFTKKDFLVRRKSCRCRLCGFKKDSL